MSSPYRLTGGVSDGLRTGFCFSKPGRMSGNNLVKRWGAMERECDGINFLELHRLKFQGLSSGNCLTSLFSSGFSMISLHPLKSAEPFTGWAWVWDLSLLPLHLSLSLSSHLGCVGVTFGTQGRLFFSSVVWAELWPLKFICWSPNSQHLSMWILRDGAFTEVIQLKWGH